MKIFTGQMRHQDGKRFHYISFIIVGVKPYELPILKTDE